MEVSAALRLVEVVEIVVDTVCAQDLVRDVGTEEDVGLVLEDGRLVARPQFQPRAREGGRVCVRASVCKCMCARFSCRGQPAAVF